MADDDRIFIAFEFIDDEWQPNLLARSERVRHSSQYYVDCLDSLLSELKFYKNIAKLMLTSGSFAMFVVASNTSLHF